MNLVRLKVGDFSYHLRVILPNSLLIKVFRYTLTLYFAVETSGRVHEVQEASLTTQAEGA